MSDQKQYDRGMTNPAPRWADTDTARKYLGISRDTLWRYTRDGVITKATIGTTVRYDLNELDRILRGDTTTRTDAVRAALEKVRAAHPLGGRPLMNVADLHRTLDNIAETL